MRKFIEAYLLLLVGVLTVARGLYDIYPPLLWIWFGLIIILGGFATIENS